MKRFVFPLERIRAWNEMQLQIEAAHGKSGSNPKHAVTLRVRRQIDQFLKQSAQEVSKIDETMPQMLMIAGNLG
jgi:flagellar biosynthesis/type III secretory pathway ATPase